MPETETIGGITSIEKLGKILNEISTAKTNAKAQADKIIADAKTAEENALAELSKQVQKDAKNISFTCRKCKIPLPINKVTFLRSIYHVPPRGCNEGDYDVPQKTEVCHIECPECNYENYICTHPQKEAILYLEEQLGEYKFESLFKEKKDKRV